MFNCFKCGAKSPIDIRIENNEAKYVWVGWGWKMPNRGKY